MAAVRRRTYKQFCGVARALDVVGERWTLLIVRDLLLGPRRYSDLMAELPGITTNLLAKRLAELTAAGLVELQGARYALAPAGAALEPVIMELGRWGGRYMDRPRPGDRMDLGWALLSAKRRYGGGVRAILDLQATDGRRFELGFTARALAVAERPAARAGAIVRGSADDLRIVFASPDAAAAARAARALAVTGDGEKWRAVLAALVRGVPARPTGR